MIAEDGGQGYIDFSHFSTEFHDVLRDRAEKMLF